MTAVTWLHAAGQRRRGTGRPGYRADTVSQAIDRSAGGKSMQWRTDILGDGFQAAPSRRPARTASAHCHPGAPRPRPPRSTATPAAPGRSGLLEPGTTAPPVRRSSSCTAGATTSSTWNSPSSGPAGASGSSRWTCTTMAGACGLAHGGYITGPRQLRRRNHGRDRHHRLTRPPGEAPPLRMGHSTGGLIAALWADRHPGRYLALVLDSPWLEVQGSPAVRRAAPDHGGPVRAVLARVRDPAAGACLLLAQHQQRRGGRMGAGRRLPSAQAFPVRAGWLSAVLSRPGARWPAA